MPDVQTAKQLAVKLLAQREHATAELHNKLTRKGCSSAVADTVITWCQENDLQSDERFSSLYTRQRAARRYGPVRIRAELISRHINSELIDSALAQPELEWEQLALACLQRRQDDLNDYQQRGKASQALLRRGFTNDQIKQAVAIALSADDQHY